MNTSNVMSDSQTTLVLIGCGSSKRESREYSFQLYDSDYFAKKVAYAVTIGEPAILSAEHGVVYFDEKLDHYDTHINDLTDDELLQWVENVSEELLTRQPDELVLLIPQNYINPLSDTFSELRDRGTTIVTPFDETSGIGEQYELLDNRVQEQRTERSNPTSSAMELF